MLARTGPAFLGVPQGTRLMPSTASHDQATLCSSQRFPDAEITAADCPGRVVRDSPQEERAPATSRQNGQAKRTGKPDRRSLKRMETLTLILHKSKETKHKVVVRHQGWQCHPERLHRQGRTGRRLASHDTGRHIPAVIPGTGFSIHLQRTNPIGCRAPFGVVGGGTISSWRSKP